jgi:hypothetical protein
METVYMSTGERYSKIRDRTSSGRSRNVRYWEEVGDNTPVVENELASWHSLSRIMLCIVEHRAKIARSTGWRRPQRFSLSYLSTLSRKIR